MTHQEFINEYIVHEQWNIKDGVLYINTALDFVEYKKPPISELPDNLHIKKWLDIQETNIIKLPENLYVGGPLYCRRSNIKSLPDSIMLGCLVWCVGDGFLEVSEKTQMRLVSQRKDVIMCFSNPTEKAKILHKLLWKL